MKKGWKIVLCILLALVLVVGGYVAYVLIDYHRIGNQELAVQNGAAETSIAAGETYKIVSYNIGFGAYESDYGFFMDGGTESRAWSEERLTANLDRIARTLTDQNADFYLVQEVDIDSTRSYHVDEREPLYAALSWENSVFCQNYDISNGSVGKMYDAEGIAELMLRLQGKGAHNVNLVSPAPFVPVLADAIRAAKNRGLSMPVVYNTNSYETLEALRMLDGLVDIYLPDLKYVSGAVSKKYSGTENYFEYAAPAIREMFRQTGLLELDGDGLANKGVIIRHLVLPGSVDETRRVLKYIAENFPKNITVSLMSQYVPCYKAEKIPPLNRKLLRREYERAVDYCLSLGLENAFIQKMDSAKREYTPVFDGKCD